MAPAARLPQGQPGSILHHFCRSSQMSERDYQVIVVGAGAAGMMCAAVAGQRGRRVLLLDHADKLAEKIRISGGGRCNFTNLEVTAANFLSSNPHFCRSALSRYGSRDFIGWSSATASPTTRRRWASCSAMTARNRSSTCCSPSALPGPWNGPCPAVSAL